ncbi:MAG: deoxyribonuclease IV [Bacilli bacterium]|nr:deoxyribonuclease IV [Bacilli bacterium]
MLYIGSHVSFTKEKQLLGSVEEALSYNANTFMFYTGAPQNTNRSPINDFLTIEALNKIKESDIDFSKVIVHAPYIINLANKEKIDNYSFSMRFLTEEIERCAQLGIRYLVLHPGSHVGVGVEVGINNIAEALNKVLTTNNQDVMILLETMAGKGSEVGTTFEELKEIIDRVDKKERLGICLDTCHLSDSGYDINNFDQLLDNFDKIIGIEKIKAIHINDSKNPKNAKKDRHENFGFGELGFNNLINIVYNKRLEDIPKILETPYLDHKFAPYKFEIEMIKNKEFDEKLLEKIRNQ